MSVYTDKQFISLISTRLEKFTQKNDYLWNFRCPLCGDSKKNKHRCRGYFYRKKSNISYLCHNCGASMSFGNFLKTLDPHLFSQYQLETYKNQSGGNVAKPDFSMAAGKPVFNKKKSFSIPSIAELPDSHFGKKYILDRKVPAERLTEIYYTDDYKSFIKETFPNYNKKLVDNDKRIVLPFYDQDNNLLGVQGRTVTDSKIKYITIKSNDDAMKIFGLNRVDLTKPVYVVEGPIDSMFIPNCIATMDASLYTIITILGDHDYIFIHDNEPRNSAIVKQISRSIETGHKVCIWPTYTQEKDINDMVMSGITSSELLHIIDTNTYQGLKAKLQFEMWRKL